MLIYGFFLLVVSFLRPSLILCLVVALAAKTASHFYPENAFECAQYFFVGGAVQAVAGSLSHRYKLVAFGVYVLGLCLSIGTHFRFGSIIGFSFFVVASFALLDEVISLQRSRVVKLGDLTYASYLLHFPVQLAVVLAIDAMGLSRNLFLAPAALAGLYPGDFRLGLDRSSGLRNAGAGRASRGVASAQRTRRHHCGLNKAERPSAVLGRPMARHHASAYSLAGAPMR